MCHPARIIAEAEILPGASQTGVHDFGVGMVGELRVAGNVVAVRVGMEYEQPVAVPGIFEQPVRDEVVDDPAQGEDVGRRRGAGVDEDGLIIAEHQEHKRRFAVDRHVLPQDDGVLVVGIHLDVWDFCHDHSQERRLGGPGTAHISSGGGLVSASGWNLSCLCRPAS